MFWLTGPGADNNADYEKLPDLATFQMRARVFGGNDKCCIKGCPEIASNRKIKCLTGVYELKLSPDFLRQTNFQDIYICNHHYYLHKKHGYKPNQPHSKAKHASQTTSKTDFQSHKKDDWLAGLDVKKCSSCAKCDVVTKTSPCPQHILTVASKSYMCACNCFDEKSDGKEANRDIYETNSDIYDCIPDYEDQLSTL